MDNKVACPSCGKSVHKYAMNRHKEIHKGLTYDCTNCEKKFKTKYSLYDHSKTHKEVIEINCSEYGEIFKSKSVLKKHKLTTHKGVSFECIYCFKELDSKQYLKNQQLELGAQIQTKLRFTGESNLEENMSELKSLHGEFNDISDSIVRCNASLQGKLVEKNPLMGETEKKLEDSLTKLNMHRASLWG